MYTVRLRLRLAERDRRTVEKRFFAVNKLHNTLISHAKKLIHRMRADHKYQDALKEYISLKGNDGPEASKRRAELSKWMSGWRRENGLTKSGFETYAKKWRRRYTNLVSSQQMQAEAARVWKSAESVVFGSGKELHYRKISDMHSIGGKSNLNGARFDPAGLMVNWMGLTIPCRADWKDPYMRQALHLDSPGDALDISCCEICREPFRNG